MVDEHTYKPNPAKVVKIIDETPDIKTFVLKFGKPADRKHFSFMPGQFGLFSLMGIGEAPFSMCSTPKDPEIKISVRNVGNVTNSMLTMKKGDLLGVRGPYGNGFPVDEIKGKDVIIVAGGIGFPPLASTVEYILQKRKDYGRIWVIYGVEHVNDIVYRSSASRWKRAKNLEMITTVEEKCKGWEGCVGLVTDPLKKLKINPANTVGLSCGPSVMLKFVSQAFQKLGIDDLDIHLSFERMMQCGIGKCGHCNIGDKYVCRDGPIFSLREIKRMQEEVW
ncbi:MAG: FAD/NAD(P)-binding protein [Candidatus Aenigmatarchaeota archaeon]|nr:MAG: FAD/NAD(P)-binding protein [Candidatus Aenigmarchaeota archaeon]